MLAAQVLINALVLGCLYACIAIGFSLVWGVLNVINLIHGSFIVLGAYLAWGLYQSLHISPWYALGIAAPAFFVLGYVIQRLILNRVITAPVLVTLTLTFGLDLILNNAMIYYFKADYRKLTLTPPMGSVSLFDVVVPVDRLIATASALALTGVLYLILRRLRVGRAIVAVRLDRDAASADGRRCQFDLCDRVRSWRGAGGLRRRADGADLPDLAADVHGLSRQGLRGLRARRPWQRVRRAGGRHSAGVDRRRLVRR